MNLVETVKDLITKEVLNQISSSIGVDHHKAEAAVNSAIPTVLASLLKTATAPGGAEKLNKTITQGDLPSIGNLTEVLGDAAKMIAKGATLMTAIFGDNATNVIIGLISKFGGVDLGASKKLISYLLPFILSTLAGKSAGKGSQGLLSLLTSQKENITKALPAGLSLASLPDVHVQAPTPAAAEAGFPKWLLGALALGALAALAYLMMPVSEPPKADVAVPVLLNKPQATTAAPKAEPVVTEKAPLPLLPDAATLSKNYTDLFASLTETLNSVKDSDSAAKAVDKLKEYSTKLDGLKEIVGKLSAEVKTKVMEGLKAGVDKLKALYTKVLELPGVSEKIKSITDEINKKLGELVG